MLELASNTDPRWLPQALADMDLILLDHAHCEKKAASTALSTLFRYQHLPSLVGPLAALAREELDHFLQVLEVLNRRGVVFRELHPSAYGARLHRAVRKPDPDHLVDTLLAAALIEARSCERMKLLAEALPDAELAGFYRDLLAAEARHFHTYLDMASQVRPRPEVVARLRALASVEAEAILAPATELRLHSAALTPSGAPPPGSPP